MSGSLAGRAAALALATVLTVLVGGMPPVATGSDAPEGALPAATTDAFAALAPPGDDHSPLLLRLPPAGTDPVPRRSDRRPGKRGSLSVEQPVVPHDFALRLLDPGRFTAPRPLTRVSGPPEDEPAPPAGPGETQETPAAPASDPGRSTTMDPTAEPPPPPPTGPGEEDDGEVSPVSTERHPVAPASDSDTSTTMDPTAESPSPLPPPTRLDDVRDDEVAAVSTEREPIKMVTIPLGQSRRWTLDHQATAVFAATPEIADVRLLSPNLLYVIGRGVGRTSVAVLDDHGLLDEWLVTIVLDLEPVHALLASDPSFGGVDVQHFSRGVTLTGEVDSVAVAERAFRLVTATLPEGAILENEIDVRAPQQVNLEVQIAEVQRSVTESLGISWEAIGRVGEGVVAWQIGRTQGAGLFAASAGGQPQFTTGFVEGEPTASIGGRYVGARGAVQGVVDALASAGLANVLARPNLTAISGETASFFSGGEYPLPVGFRDGVIIFEYKKYGVLLDFVPTVVDSDRITLTVRPEVSETSDVQSLVTVGTEIPVINVRRAETTVELGSGESIVIAGLFRSGSNSVESGFPGLKDLPVFGQLFRQERVEASETELIVVVTANLVRSGRPRSGAPAGPVSATRRIHGYYF
ncbi:MAG: pilus assembly protein N-terminal domain-containing protein [Rhodospirillales bacterium]|nr:pilus assembly protein N-terminal domain-containing protein [Rhodospirillales bacterium]